MAAHADAKAMLPEDATADFQVAVLSAYADALEDFGWYLDSGDQAATALEIAEQAQLDEAQARVLPTLGFSVAYLGDPDRGVALMQRGVQIATDTGHPDAIGRAHLRLCGLLGGPLNRMSEAIETGRRAAPILSSLGLDRTYGAALQAFIANALFRIGDWTAADAAVEEALAANPTGTASLELRLARCRLLVGVGELARAEDELGLVEILCAQTVGSRYRIPLLTLRAGLEMWRGRFDLARESREPRPQRGDGEHRIGLGTGAVGLARAARRSRPRRDRRRSPAAPARRRSRSCARRCSNSPTSRRPLPCRCAPR